MDILLRVISLITLLVAIAVACKAYSCLLVMTRYRAKKLKVNYASKNKKYLARVTSYMTSVAVAYHQYLYLVGWAHNKEARTELSVQMQEVIENLNYLESVARWKSAARSSIYLKFDMAEESVIRTVELAWKQNLLNNNNDICSALRVSMGSQIFNNGIGHHG